MAPFLAMAELKQALFLLIWLNENALMTFRNALSVSQKGVKNKKYLKK